MVCDAWVVVEAGENDEDVDVAESAVVGIFDFWVKKRAFWWPLWREVLPPNVVRESPATLGQGQPFLVGEKALFA